MTKRDMSEAQIMADILDKLVTARMWGAGHQDIGQLKGWLISQLKKNGRRVDRAINRLYREGLIGKKNNGRSIYGNIGRRSEIGDFIDEHFVDDWAKFKKDKQRALKESDKSG